MKYNELKARMALMDMSVDDLIDNLSKIGVPMKKCSYYRTMKGEREFNRLEIWGMIKVLELSEEQVTSIFFGL